MNKLLEQIFELKKFTNSKGETLEVYSETSRGQCEFLQKIVRENKFRKSLEIGCAFGISALAIVEEVAKNDGRHCLIDKFQKEDWNNNGLDLLQQAGYMDKIDFHEKYSYEVLAGLLTGNKKFDFVYIDSTKQFDWLLVDFFLIDKLLDVNGVIVFDDVAYFSIRKLIRLISQFPGYTVLEQFPGNMKPGIIGRVAGEIISRTFLKRFLKAGLSYRDYKLGINSAGGLALKKISEDKRDWKWHVDF